MDEYNFLSIEQRTNLYKRAKNIDRSFYLSLLLVLLIFLFRLYSFRNQIKELNLIIESSRNKAVFNNLTMDKNNISRSINTYMNITNMLKENKESYDFDKLMVENNVIKIENYLIDSAKAANLINYYEKNFKVLNLHMEDSSDNKVNLIMELEVIKNEK
ncbi:hypothetical protein CLHOM_05410 [Clostridium homopropionicum DSM 5847]|uniref:Fimbrial assembly protein (PilN) n=1 Tax=Clostridium homopropionicum DSM 5847 TaxID=1121318 RepID=A0A0L6ZDT0_9CLOT|nr:hypothetical protein [Clostridium homopropionicum]KOA20953.1 hypothetical protein CLHOM_05410 [Clostridium homopropionicum DSM 5847]SFG01305.1 hypothetical protein SAMN04488501_104179 [Clostridium homopropionicum]